MATAPAVEVTNWSFVAVDRIVPGENSRKLDKASPAFKGLVKSIKAVGVLQPLIVRPHPEQAETYILEAGEQRWRAAQEAGLTEAPCTIRRDDEQTAAVVTVTENMHRVDLTPLEEADAVARLIEKGLSYKDAGAWLGKSLKWVARRASLRNLTKAWREKAEEWPVEALELIARLPSEVQDRIIGELANYPYIADSLASLEHYLAGRVQFLDLAKWDLDENGLAGQPACSACSKRSSCQPDLFDKPKEKVKSDDRCLDAECWTQKQFAYQTSVVEKAQAKYGKDNLIVVAQEWRMEKVKKSTPGARPGINANPRSPDFGKVAYYEERPPETQPTAPAISDVDARKAKLRRARDKVICQLVSEHLGKALADAEICHANAQMILRMVATFGTQYNHSQWYSDVEDHSSHTRYAAMPEFEQIIEAQAAAVLPVLQRRIDVGGGRETPIKEARRDEHAVDRSDQGRPPALAQDALPHVRQR